jgi:maltooligosyltrehalose trehalohydrolase
MGGYFHDGTYSGFRGRHHGRPLDRTRVAGHRLLGYSQTHDQVGNRARGDRLSMLLADSPGLLACAAVLTLTAPFTPMLFMGEEWAATTPWQFFTDHTDPELAEAVRQGRRREFAEHGWAEEDVPDPQAPATRDRSCLDWKEPAASPHAELLSWHRDLLALRHRHPQLARTRLGAAEVSFDEAERRLVLRNGPLHVAVNLSGRAATVPVHAGDARIVAAWDPSARYAEGVLHLPPRSAAVLR